MLAAEGTELIEVVEGLDDCATLETVGIAR
jgi:hypothetical protein